MKHTDPEVRVLQSWVFESAQASLSKTPDVIKTAESTNAVRDNILWSLTSNRPKPVLIKTNASAAKAKALHSKYTAG